jgi:predicted ester cyclase
MRVNHNSSLIAVSVLLICAGSSFGSSAAEENDHAAVVKRYFEDVWSQGKLETAHQIIAPSYQFHSPNMRIVGPTGPDLVTGQVEMRREAFPDLKLTISDLVVQEDRVAVRWKAEGTHDGPLGNVEPTGKKIGYEGMSFFRVAGGQIYEEWILTSFSNVMRQLGVERLEIRR